MEDIAKQILEYEQKETIIVNNQKVTIAELRKVFNRICNKEHWKNPWVAAVPVELVGLVRAAAEYFLADKAEIIGIEAITGKVLMQGKGYQAW